MSKTFIATVLAGALAITSFTAAPARAELDNFEKFILGAGTLLIIGAAIENGNQQKSKKKKEPKVTYSTRSYSKPKVTHHKPHKPKAKVHRKRPLPAFCLTNVRSHEGPRRIYSNRCLQNNYRGVNTLPQRCKTFIQGPRGTRVGYRPRCLARAGY